MTEHFYRPSEGHRLPHNPFKAIIAPRPIGWIGTRSADGINNLAPYSFFNAFSEQPPIVGFSSIGRKDSLANAEATGFFTWNLATYALREQMNASSEGALAEVDEFELTGLTAVDSDVVDAPYVGEAKVSFECVTTQIIQIENAKGQAQEIWLLLGEVVGVHIKEDMLVNGLYQTAAAKPLMRGGGLRDFFVVDDSGLIGMDRPVIGRPKD